MLCCAFPRVPSECAVLVMISLFPIWDEFNDGLVDRLAVVYFVKSCWSTLTVARRALGSCWIWFLRRYFTYGLSFMNKGSSFFCISIGALRIVHVTQYGYVVHYSWSPNNFIVRVVVVDGTSWHTGVCFWIPFKDADMIFYMTPSDVVTYAESWGLNRERWTGT